MLGNGDGTFALPNHIAAFQTPGTPIGVADFNGDGKLDLALGVNDASTVGGVGDSVTILAGNGDGTFSYAPSGPLESLASITSINVADFNGDGVPDLSSSVRCQTTRGCFREGQDFLLIPIERTPIFRKTVGFISSVPKLPSRNSPQDGGGAGACPVGVVTPKVGKHVAEEQKVGVPTGEANEPRSNGE
jgi:hypothetical protein